MILFHKWVKYTAISAVFFMLATFMPLLGGCASDKKANQPPAEDTPSTASLHQQRMEELKALLSKAPTLSPQELKDGLAAAREDIGYLNIQMEEEFAHTSDIIGRLDLPGKQAIQDEVVAAYQRSRDRLNAALDGAIASPDTSIQAQAQSLSSLLSELCPEEEAREPLGSDLPNRIIERDPVPPVLGASICPAYMAGTPNLAPSDLPLDPTPEDLAETIDAPHTEEIIAKAAELSNDPVYIYEWVSNNIDFEPYYGSKKGAQETLSQMAGNDMDTASLLISLYRVSGIPTRYVTGVIEITSEQAMSWTCVETLEAAKRLLASGGVPISGIIEGGRLARFQLTHTWCEAYVPYTNYRGIPSGEGPKNWVPLDGSWKEYEISKATSRASQLETDMPNWITDYINSGQVGSNNITGFDYALLKSGLEDDFVSIEQSFEDIREQLLGKEFFQPGFIVEQHIELLPSVVPFAEISIQSECRELDSFLRQTLRITIKADSNIILSLSYPLVLIGNDPTFCILFSGYSEEDRAIADNYDDASEIPCYLMQVVPEIARGAEIISAGSLPVGLGEKVKLGLSLEQGIIVSTSSDDLVAGGLYSICVPPGGVSSDTLDSWEQRLTDTKSGLEAYVNYPSGQFPLDYHELVSTLVGSIGIAYWAQLLMLDDMLASASAIRKVNDACLDVSGLSLCQSYIFGVATSILPKGFYIDVDTDELSVEPCFFGKNEVAYMLGRGMIASALESQVMETLFGLEGISTTKILQIANNSNIPIFLINVANIDTCLAQTNLPLSVEDHIRQLIRSGSQVACPQQEINYKGFHGAGYAAIDPLSGSSGFYIIGANAGGNSICSLAAMNNGKPEYIENPQLPQDGSPAGNIDWVQIGASLATLISVALVKSSGALTLTGRCIALLSLLAPGLVLVNSLCMAYVEKKYGTNDIPSEIIFAGYCITTVFNIALIGALGGLIYGEPYSATAFAAATIILGIGAGMLSYIFS